MSENIGKIIDELIVMTEKVIQHSGEVDDDFIELLEERDRYFTVLETSVAGLSTDDQTGDAPALEAHRAALQELYDLHKQAEAQVGQYKDNIAEQIRKISGGKQASSLYGEGRVARSVVSRRPYKATPDAAFFDKKK